MVAELSHRFARGERSSQVVLERWSLIQADGQCRNAQVRPDQDGGAYTETERCAKHVGLDAKAAGAQR